jgi:diaminopimelate decarboxylase
VPEPDPTRIAIIGAGPKGLFALERLLDHARRRPRRRLEVDVLDPAPVPGAGPHYDPAQPGYLLMNLAAEHVDMWWPGTGVVPAPERRSFLEWSARAGIAIASGEFPPRALVGRYLAEGLGAVLRHAPARTAVRLLPVRVRGLRRVREGWIADADVHLAPYDEVLIATGHAAAGSGDREPWGATLPTVPAVFPVTRRLSGRHVPAGARVAVRGFALTFIDAALALTEGRGGRFVGAGEDGVPAYVRATGEPEVILPFSRTGSPMLAKPERGVPIDEERIVRVCEPWAARLRGLASPVSVHRDLLPLVTGAADDLLATAGAPDAAGADGRLGAEAALRRSLAVATGRARPDAAWASGQAWRTLYPALVARLGHGGLPPGEWAAFRTLAAHMERVAFGPPAVNVAKLVALVDAGLVDLTHVRGRPVVRGSGHVLRSSAGERAVDVAVDAVLPPPGVLPGDRILGDLVTAGFARVPEGRRGLDVDHEGRCLDARGRRTPGLAAIGRPTEDTVIGNDTLSRRLHDLPERWAAGLVDRLLRAGEPARERTLVAAAR